MQLLATKVEDVEFCNDFVCRLTCCVMLLLSCTGVGSVCSFAAMQARGRVCSLSINLA